MKSFKQYISENLDDIRAYRRDLGVYTAKQYLDTIPGLINPSRDQLIGYLNKVKQARFILHNDNLHVFDANDAIHDDVLRAEYPDQKDGNFGDRIEKMYKTEKSLLGSFHSGSDPEGNEFVVGLSYYRPERKDWMNNLLRTHKRTSHLLMPMAKIEPWDM